MSSRCDEACRPGTLVLVAALAAAGCTTGPPVVDRQVPPAGARMDGVRQVPLRPGLPIDAGPPEPNPLGSGPAVVNDGERLYAWMNCIGCHFDGGGGMGPPLMDAKWIYGGEPVQIFDSIVNGRPNGMPAFGDKLAADEIWRIVAYVETLSPEGEAGGTQPDARRITPVQRQSGDGQ